MAKVNLNIPPVVHQLCDLWKGSSIAYMTGNHKQYSQMRQQFASLAVQHPRITERITYPEIKVPLFSKLGFNMLKVAVKDIFRPKTKDEKALIKLLKEKEIREKAASLISKEKPYITF